MTVGHIVPYWRLSLFYFFYFAALGAILPYWSLFLKSIEFDAAQIGELTAILVGTKIVAPNIWGWIADHRGQRMLIIRIASLFACLGFAGVFLSNTFFSLAIVMMVFGFFWHATLPQFEATTLTHLGDSTHAYTKIRVWGSIGFIVTVWLLGLVFEHQDIGWLPAIMLALMIMIFMVSLWVPERAAGHLSLSKQSLLSQLKQPHIIALIVVCFLMQASHAPYYTFYSIYLDEHDYSRTFIGEMWALGVIAEVVVFVYMQRLIGVFGLKQLLIMSLLLASIRWMLIGWGIESVWIIILSQLLHAASFGIYHASAIQFFHRFFTGDLQGRGQAIYSSMSFGAGLSLGSFLSGLAWESIGPAMTYTSAAGITIIAVFVTWRWIKV